MEASVITTFRCPMRCSMCDIWNNPTNPQKEITAKDLERMPLVNVTNITGGEPLIREDLAELVEVIFKKSKRVCISTSGFYTERIFSLAETFPALGFRVSLEGLSGKMMS